MKRRVRGGGPQLELPPPELLAGPRVDLWAYPADVEQFEAAVTEEERRAAGWVVLSGAWRAWRDERAAWFVARGVAPRDRAKLWPKRR